MPLSSFRMVNADEFAQLLEHLRINVPSSIRESERMLAERDKILSEARSEALRMVEEAQRQARELISDNALVEAAEQEARRIMETSRQIALQRTQEADEYATNVLRQLGQRLDVVSQQVSNGIQMLEESAMSRAEQDEADIARAAAGK